MQTFKVSIGTSQNALNLADGLPLFPTIGATRTGITDTARSNFWTDATQATDCNTCGRDIRVGERCVIFGQTIHCYGCGASVAHYEDTGEAHPGDVQ